MKVLNFKIVFKVETPKYWANFEEKTRILKRLLSSKYGNVKINIDSNRIKVQYTITSHENSFMDDFIIAFFMVDDAIMEKLN